MLQIHLPYVRRDRDLFPARLGLRHPAASSPSQAWASAVCPSSPSAEPGRSGEPGTCGSRRTPRAARGRVASPTAEGAAVRRAPEIRATPGSPGGAAWVRAHAPQRCTRAERARGSAGETRLLCSPGGSLRTRASGDETAGGSRAGAAAPGPPRSLRLCRKGAGPRAGAARPAALGVVPPGAGAEAGAGPAAARFRRAPPRPACCGLARPRSHVGLCGRRLRRRGRRAGGGGASLAQPRECEDNGHPARV